jgi:hypothetical protein
MRPVSIFVLCLTALLAQPATDSRWAPLAFLIGNWIGEGGGGPGQGTGGFSFQLEQNGAILIRKNVSNYPATKDKPAYSHTDLMIVYQEPGETKLRAIYFDDEGHTIHYTVAAAADGTMVQFLSHASPTQPGYRLTYRKTGEDRVAIRFEIAPPDHQEAFSTYIEATARRKQR